MSTHSFEDEIEALKTVLTALEPLDSPQRVSVLKMAIERLQIPFLPVSGSRRQNNEDEAPAESNRNLAQTNASQSQTTQDPKKFLKSKAPRTELLRVACLAYYLTNNQGQPNFTTGDLTKLNADAGGTELSNPSNIVGNAIRQSKFLAPAHGGKKRITSLGEEIVEALPDMAAVKAVKSKHKKPRKRRKTSAAK